MACYPEERAAARAIWRDFKERTRQSRTAKIMLAQYALGILFWIAPVESPVYSNLLYVPKYQVAVSTVYTFWPDVPRLLVKYKVPVMVQLVGLVFWMQVFGYGFDEFLRFLSYEHERPWRDPSFFQPLFFTLVILPLLFQTIIFIATVRQFLVETKPVQLESPSPSEH